MSNPNSGPGCRLLHLILNLRLPLNEDLFESILKFRTDFQTMYFAILQLRIAEFEMACKFWNFIMRDIKGLLLLRAIIFVQIFMIFSSFRKISVPYKSSLPSDYLLMKTLAFCSLLKVGLVSLPIQWAFMRL